jgi:UDP-3-O-[3-hydroxymyristoyl] glucosamine N-acyltransferase
MKRSRTYKLSELADIVGGRVDGDGQLSVSGIADLLEAGPEDISWVSSERFASRLAESRAGAVLVREDFGLTPMPCIRCPNIERSVAQLLGAFAAPVARPEVGIHASAIVHDTATIGPNPSIGPHVVVERDVHIGSNCVIHSGVFVGRDTTIGDDCVIWPNAVIRDGCVIGHRVVIYPCAVIGADGFGFYFDEGRHNKYPHVGGVIIGDDVEIGACSCVDRSKFGYTTVGRGTKIDNLVQVGHNVRIGEHCVLAGQLGMAGSVRIGDYCALGGQVAITDSVRLGRGVRAAGGLTTITHDVPDGITVSGYPAQEHRKEMREQVLVRRLPKLVEQLKDLITRVERLEQSRDRKGAET